MSPGDCPKAGPEAGFPRVSGDEPQAILQLGFDDVFSPRERG